MAAFSHHQRPPFEVDSVSWPNSSLKTFGIFDESFPNLNQFRPSSGHQSLLHQQGYSLDASAHESNCVEQQSINNEPSATIKQRSVQMSISMEDNNSESREQFTQNFVPLDKKRKSKLGSSSFSANSKEIKQVKCKKPKEEKVAKKEVKNDKDKENQNQPTEKPPKGYIHVRARRGQATDSHSLAERVRREKISERMKMLQALVPGCDKVTGKALMLDEIINYVQSLQNQVEFLSLKLASLDPMVHTYGLMNVDPSAFEIEGMNNNMTLPMLQQMPCTTVSATSSGAAQPLALADTNTITATATTFPYPLVDSSSSLLQLEQKQNVLPLQDDRSSYWGVLDDQQQRQSLINQFCFTINNNWCSFH